MLVSKTFRSTPYLRILLLGLFPLCTVVMPSSAIAGCVSSDINAQYVIGSRPTNSPPTQTNNLNVQYGENCLGNSSHGNNLQLHSGTESVVQKRERNAYLGSGEENRLPGLNTPNIDARVNQQLYFPRSPQIAP